MDDENQAAAAPARAAVRTTFAIVTAWTMAERTYRGQCVGRDAAIAPNRATMGIPAE